MILDELRDRFPWGDAPSVAPYAHSFLEDSTRDYLISLCAIRRPKLVLELGAWLGASPKLFLENSEATVISVDHWDAEKLLPWAQSRHKRLVPVIERGVRETFMANLWDHRERVIPVQLDSQDAVKLVADTAIDTVFLDTSHTYDVTLAELQTIRSYLPRSFVCGDDWDWGVERDYPVRRALATFLADTPDLEIEVSGNAWSLIPTPATG